MTEPLSVTVIMPIRNEARNISNTLGKVLAQEYPAAAMQILVVDGMSDDGSREIIQGLQQNHSNLFLLDNPHKIVPTAMNIALRQAKGEIILRVDGHTEIAPDFVRQCVETLQRTGADNVGGRMNAIGRTPFGNAVALATSTPFGVGGSRFHYSDEEEWVDTVYMGAWPRQVFEKIGLFDEELVRDQDDEFNYRLREKGGRILLSPAIRSEYTVRSTPIALLRQYLGYGYWKVRVLQKHPLQMSLRQFVPPALVALLFASALLLFFPFPAFILHPSSFILILYLIANLTASIWTIIKSVRATHHLLLTILYFLLTLPLIFAILHLGYGLGFLIGLVKFANRWGDKDGKVPEWKNALNSS